MHKSFIEMINAGMGPWHAAEHTIQWSNILKLIPEIKDLNLLVEGKTLMGHVAKSHLPDTLSQSLIKALIQAGADPLDLSHTQNFHGRSINLAISKKKYQTAIDLLNHPGQADQVIYPLIRPPQHKKDGNQLFSLHQKIWEQASTENKKDLVVEFFVDMFGYEFLTGQRMKNEAQLELKSLMKENGGFVNNINYITDRLSTFSELLNKEKIAQQRLDGLLGRWIADLYDPDIDSEIFVMTFNTPVKHFMNNLTKRMVELKRADISEMTPPVSLLRKNPRL
jgi:hypothetical protein